MIGKWILIFGVVLIVVGTMVWLVESLGLPLGRLPGDIRARGEGWSFSFPIVSCILVSIVLTVLRRVPSHGIQPGYASGGRSGGVRCTKPGSWNFSSKGIRNPLAKRLFTLATPTCSP